MGRNKAFVEIGGRPRVLRVVERVRQAGASRVVAVGADDRLSSLLEPHGVSTISDRWPGEGPAGGVITALAASDTDASTVVLVVACDHPDLVSADLALLVSAVQDGAPAAVAVAGGAAHPTVGAWRASTCLDAATHWFAAGGRTMGGLLEAVGGVHVEVDDQHAQQRTMTAAVPRPDFTSRSASKSMRTVSQIDLGRTGTDAPPGMMP